MASIYHAPQLPWSDADDRRLFWPLLTGLLLLVVIAGVVIPAVDLPQRDRQDLERLPPQLARVIERKKLQQPKPLPVPEKQPPPETKVMEAEPVVEKPKPLPVPKEQPKPQPKPVQKPVTEATAEQRQQAKETARKAFGNEALQALSQIRSDVPLAALGTSGQELNNAGSAATSVGSVVDRAAAGRSSGGVDDSTLTRATAGEQLAERQLTEVAVTEEQEQATAAASTRSQEELRLVFEQYKVQFDRIYRGALRKNPTLSGSVTLRLDVQPDGTVSQCTVLTSELNDARLHKRLESKCRQMTFASRPGVDLTVVEFPIRFMP